MLVRQRRHHFLTRHILFILAFLLVPGGAAVFWYSHQQSQRLNEEISVQEASLFAHSLERFRTFYSEQIIPRAQAHGVPLTHDPHNTDAMPVPPTLMAELGKILAKDTDASYQMRVYSEHPFPWNKEGGAHDDFERWALQELTKNPKKVVWRFETDQNGQKRLRYAMPNLMSASCIGCHQSYAGTPKTDWKIGDLLGVTSISRNAGAIEKAAEKSMTESFLLVLGLGLLGLGVLAAALRSLYRSLRHAHEATEEARKANQELAQGIKERDELAATLRATQVKTRTIVDSIADALIVINAEGTIIETNPAVQAVFGYTQQELQGQNTSLLIHGEQAAQHTQHIQQYLATGETHVLGKTLQLPARHKDGRTIQIEMTINEASVDGKVIFTSIARDITERLQAKQELAKARDAALESVRLKSEFLANMSHEIRTPMNAVIGMSHMLLETQLTHDQHELAQTVLQSGEELLSIINDILDFSRIEAGKFNIYKGNFILLEMLEGVINLLAESASGKGLELAFFIGPNVPASLISDSVRLRQILLNLLGNAIKFTAQGYVALKVSVAETRADSLLLRFEVRDTGCGIDAEDLPKLFAAFSQLDGSSTRQYGGTGLGLAISKQLAHLLGGETGVESKPGEGAAFWFTVEVQALEQPKPLQIPAGFRLLMLGIDAALNQHYAAQMQQWGITPVMADHLSSLLLVLEKDAAPNLVMLDIDLLYHQPDHPQGIQAVVSVIREYTVAPIILYGRCKHVQALREIDLGQAVYVADKPLRHSLFFRQLERLQPRRTESGNGTAIPPPAMMPAVAPEMPKAEPEDKVPAPAASVLELSPAERHEAHILLVEDHLVNQKVALAMLKRLGYAPADCAVNGQEAVRMVQAQDYDLVLMDCQMPVLDGYEATRQIRLLEGDKFKTLPIIALTAHAMKGDDEKCYAAGMDDYLTKPIPPENLQKHVDKWLRAKGLTLVELMVTLAVSGALMMAAVPSLTSLRLGNALTSQANEMLGVLNFARSEAIRRNAPVRVCRAASETATACVTALGNWQHWIVLVGNSVVRRGVVPTGSGLTQTSDLIADTVTFGADGLARTNNALVNNQGLEIDAPIGSVAEDTRRVVLGAGSRTSVSKVSREHEDDDDEHDDDDD